jgi:hypothetical protein
MLFNPTTAENVRKYLAKCSTNRLEEWYHLMGMMLQERDYRAIGKATLHKGTKAKK